MRDEGTRTGKDFEEGIQIATEISAYLLYIQVRQNQILIEKAEE